MYKTIGAVSTRILFGDKNPYLQSFKTPYRIVRDPSDFMVKSPLIRNP